MKKAIAVISFGTSYDTGKKAIEYIESYISDKFKEYDCFRAFTSGMIMKKLKKEQGIVIPTTEELLQQLKEEGYEEVICQPTHIIHGMEFDKMMDQIRKFQGCFQSLKVGMPLLNEEKDYRQCVELYKKEIKIHEKEALVLMGHGSEHYANSAYCQMEKMFEVEGIENVYVGTVEGFPTFMDIMTQIKKKDYNKIILSPFMIVAGDHAYNDMIGEDEDSWKSQFEQEGYETEIYIKGMGEYEEIAKIFEEHIRKAVELS